EKTLPSAASKDGPGHSYASSLVWVHFLTLDKVSAISERPLSANSRRSSEFMGHSVSPFHSLTRLKDSCVDRSRDQCDLTVTFRRRRREQKVEVLAERPKP